jgi:hypothetical protein
MPSCTVQIAEVRASKLCRTRRRAAESPSRAAAMFFSDAKAGLAEIIAAVKALVSA